MEKGGAFIKNLLTLFDVHEILRLCTLQILKNFQFLVPKNNLNLKNKTLWKSKSKIKLKTVINMHFVAGYYGLVHNTQTFWVSYFGHNIGQDSPSICILYLPFDSNTAFANNTRRLAAYKNHVLIVCVIFR